MIYQKHCSEGERNSFIVLSVFPLPFPFKEKKGAEEEVQERLLSLWAMKILWVSDSLGIKISTHSPSKLSNLSIKFWNEMEISSSEPLEMTSLDFSMVLKTCVCAAAPDTSLDITAIRTKADQGALSTLLGWCCIREDGDEAGRRKAVML